MRTRWYLLMMTVFLSIMWYPAHKGQCANRAFFEDGDIVFETKDTIATSNIRWSVTGFQICRQKTGGNPARAEQCGILYLKEEHRTKVNTGTGTYKVVYRIPAEEVDRVLVQGDLTGIKDGDTLYFNGIFQVVRNGKPDRHHYMTLSSIRDAAVWRNPDDFKDHFDVKVVFQSADYPIIMEYRSVAGGLLEEERLGQYKSGSMITVAVKNFGIWQEEEYKLREYYTVSLYDESVRCDYAIPKDDGNAETEYRLKVPVGGAKIIAIMEANSETDSDILEGGLPEPLNARIRLAAETPENEEYLVSEGIPATEALYCNVFCPEWITAWRFQKIKGRKIYSVQVVQPWYQYVTVTRIVDGKEIITEETVYGETQQSIAVRREYSYWIIDEFDLLTPENAVVRNDALNKGKTALHNETGNNVPFVIERRSEEEHIQEPNVPDNIVLPTIQLSGGIGDLSYAAENAVDDIKVRNDYLEVDGTVWMTGEQSIQKGTVPSGMRETGPEMMAFAERNLIIPAQTANGWKETKGTVGYVNQVAYRENQTVDYDVEGNSVLIHTPVVCDGAVEDKKSLCQLASPDGELCQLVLDSNFHVLLPSYGIHKEARGYYERNYLPYCRDRQVRFPFDVYTCDDAGNPIRYIKSATWISVGEETEFYLPAWAEEGTYRIMFRSLACNLPEGTEEEIPSQPFFNGDWNYYSALDEVEVRISGRLHQLKVYDIGDYPRWQRIFRKENSLKRTGMYLTPGEFPLTEQKNALLPIREGLRTGYPVRCEITSIGSFYGEDAELVLEPVYYVLNTEASEKREADVYYSGTVDGIYYPLIRAGSSLDGQNGKSLRLSSPYTAVETGEQYEEEQSCIYYGYGRRRFSYGARTLSGENYLCNDVGLDGFPVNSDIIDRSVQKWYFVFSMPAQIYVTEKNAPVGAYSKTHRIDFQEDFWIKEGYLLVEWKIQLYRDGEVILDYINQKNAMNGYCSQWSNEAGDNDSEPGIALLYELNHGTDDDYNVYGTH